MIIFFGLSVVFLMTLFLSRGLFETREDVFKEQLRRGIGETLTITPSMLITPDYSFGGFLSDNQFYLLKDKNKYIFNCFKGQIINIVFDSFKGEVFYKRFKIIDYDINKNKIVFEELEYSSSKSHLYKSYM